MTTMLESQFQNHLIRRIEDHLLPGSIVLKNDANLRPGIPDLTVFYYNWWGTLEVKKSAHERFRPNQEYYVAVMDELSFSAVIYPENEEEVLDALQQSYRASRAARLPRR